MADSKSGNKGGCPKKKKGMNGETKVHLQQKTFVLL